MFKPERGKGIFSYMDTLGQ